MKENDPLGRSLIRAVSVAMEYIAFEEPEVLSEPVLIKGETIALSLQVVSPYLFQTRIIIEKELAARLTRTIYQEDDREIADALLHDSMGEFLNTIIGTMMGDLTLGERIFEMGLPERDSGELEKLETHIRRYFFRIEELCFCVEISGDVFVES